MHVESFTYVSRRSPSPSGVALYADRFVSVLEELAPTHGVLLPAQPSDSQRASVALRTLVRTIRASTSAATDVIVVELAGRGVAEFWTAFVLSYPPWRRRLWLTVHDSPAVSGGAFFFRSLDHHGRRRIAKLLSDRIGRRAERALLLRAERVYCLSILGANQLEHRLALGHTVRLLPHVAATTDSPVSERRSVFLPGYLDGIENIRPVLSALASADQRWRLEIGACGDVTRSDIAALARELGVHDRVEMLGFLDEKALFQAFERAAIAVRWNVAGWSGEGCSQNGAVSGALINAMAHGCAIVTNDTRGIRECLTDAGSIEIGSGDSGGDELRSMVSMLIVDASQREVMGASGRNHIAQEHEMLAVVRKLTGE